MADHYMVEPVACSPAAGREKGRVEHQVQTARGRFFRPRLRFASLEELNGWLEADCRRWAALCPHPEHKELTAGRARDAERPALQAMPAPFDGFHETPHAVTGPCLIGFDRNRYSVMAKAARRGAGPCLGRPDRRAPGRRGRRRASSLLRARPDDPRSVALSAGAGQEAGRSRPGFRQRSCWKGGGGALRNGAPFRDRELPPARARLRRKLGTGDEADRRFVRVLSAVLTDGLEAVEEAIREAIDAGAASDDVSATSWRAGASRPGRRRSSRRTRSLAHAPIADCARCDRSRGARAAA